MSMGLTVLRCETKFIQRYCGVGAAYRLVIVIFVLAIALLKIQIGMFMQDVSKITYQKSITHKQIDNKL